MDSYGRKEYLARLEMDFRSADSATYRRTDEELTQIAKDIYSGLIFTDRHVRNANELVIVFMPLIGADQWLQERLGENGMIFQYISEAGPRSVNGMPTFFSMKTLSTEETDFVFAKYERVKEVMESV